MQTDHWIFHSQDTERWDEINLHSQTKILLSLVNFSVPLFLLCKIKLVAFSQDIVSENCLLFFHILFHILLREFNKYFVNEYNVTGDGLRNGNINN